MTITSEQINDITLLRISGKLEAGNDFEARITSLLKSDTKKLAIDLAGLKYISSSGLRVFLIAAKQLKKSGGYLVLFSLGQNIREIFDLTGFSSFIPIVDSEKEALEKCGTAIS